MMASIPSSTPWTYMDFSYEVCAAQWNLNRTNGVNKISGRTFRGEQLFLFDQRFGCVHVRLLLNGVLQFLRQGFQSPVDIFMSCQDDFHVGGVHVSLSSRFPIISIDRYLSFDGGILDISYTLPLRTNLSLVVISSLYLMLAITW